jgi:hypothetical protein
MKTYLVTWEIEVYAESAEEAARNAQCIQRDPTSITAYFTVTNIDTGEQCGVGLDKLVEVRP